MLQLWLWATLAVSALIAPSPDSGPEPDHFLAGDFGVPLGGRLADPAALGFVSKGASANRHYWTRSGEQFWREINLITIDGGIVVSVGANRLFPAASPAEALAVCRTHQARLRAELLARFPRLRRFARFERLVYPDGNGDVFAEQVAPDGQASGREVSLVCSTPRNGTEAVMLYIIYRIDLREWNALQDRPPQAPGTGSTHKRDPSALNPRLTNPS